ncbi:MAG TPA: peptidoglycan synthetase [Bacteroidetes bacterium]|nr:peptidoglycan synthetase [Bacteroidota bacterium]
MRIHLISIGGSAMHNLAIALHCNHHTVTGSDDEVYNPSRDRLSKYGLLPKQMGWNEKRISKDIDVIILGMHARKDNPELAKAKKLKIPIYSYPQFIYQHSKNKTRLVVAGSHGKTTTTSMIMHVLKYHKKDFDYLVGAQIEGFETMVRLSDAPLIVIEGDEYLSSPIDRRPKMLHYFPQIAIITGIAWDHINVFPTFENYVEQFSLFIKSIKKKGSLFFYEGDQHLQKLVKQKKRPKKVQAYSAFDAKVKNGKTLLLTKDKKKVPLKIFGQHNLQNFKAAYLACKEVGISDAEFFEAIPSFKGASKRLQTLYRKKDAIAFLDYAHAPSKVKATIEAMKSQFPKRKLIACLELHTFSSLNKKFHSHYKNAMNAADKAFVYYSDHTLKMKRLAPLNAKQVAKKFNHPNIKVITNNEDLVRALKRFKWNDKNLLMMTSGTFNGLNLKLLAKDILKDK